jgi:hypothetical protein
MTVLSASIVIVAGFVLPVTSPDQPVKVKLVAGVAVRVTTAPETYVPPAGSRVTAPLPILMTVRVWVPNAKVAVTVLSASIVIVAGFVLPVTSPDQPVKVKLVAGVAVRVIIVPDV